VCSHRRSGTHLLAATIWTNFYIKNTEAIVEVEGQKWFASNQQKALVQWQRILGKHEPFSECGINKDCILYIVRHPVDCFYSFWNFMAFGRSIEEIITKDRIEYWYKHTKGYTNNCRWIRYEDLTGQRFDEILYFIEKEFSLRRRHKNFIRINEKVGWSPKEAKSGYSSMIKPEILNLFKEIIPDGYLGYRIEV
jgi:hypothetical protein